MNLPNLLTLSRIGMSFLFIYFIFSPLGCGKALALALFLLASLTDYWDGKLARERGLITRFGTLADPIADKFLTLSALTSFAVMGLVAAPWVAIIAIRDIYVTALRLGRPSVDQVTARKSGKNKTMVQMAFIIYVLLYLACYELGWMPVDWAGPIERSIRLGMIAVVLITLWSGIRVVFKNRLSRSS